MWRYSCESKCTCVNSVHECWGYREDRVVRVCVVWGVGAFPHVGMCVTWKAVGR